ncbi:MAG TPA: TonB-dependent receptor [Microscillaceae bacterium]|nr:TonB-dependent receptor [Microscillaceae bacterium]
MKSKYPRAFTSILLQLLALSVFGQNAMITGTVQDVSGAFLEGVNIFMINNHTMLDGTQTNTQGQYTIAVRPGQYTLRVKIAGKASQDTVISLTPGQVLEKNFVLLNPAIDDQRSYVSLGSRGGARSPLESSVPIDLIDQETLQNSHQENLGQALHYLLPSFHSVHQTITDGGDFIDPASLRGLGPDQVLVLINGKRKHSSALLNVNGTLGQGTVFQDLNNIPMAAIERVEILRDGAAAQYGSDAIAGVINIVLKENKSGLLVESQSGINTAGDGFLYKVGSNYALRIAKNGFLNISGELMGREATNRSGNYTDTVFNDPAKNQNLDTFFESVGLGNRRIESVGNAAIAQQQLFFNAALPFLNGQLYAFGGLNFRQGLTRGIYRLPKDTLRTDIILHPNGFSPHILGDITDRSITIGFRTQKSGWTLDFSHSRGSNDIRFHVENSNNKSLSATINPPTSAYAGSWEYGQTVTNMDITKNIVLGHRLNFNLALGGEYRVERYAINAGDTVSYTGRGIEGFPGFNPADATDQLRANTAAYVDVEMRSRKVSVGIAARYETSRIKPAFIWKATGRYELIANRLAIRATYSTGFRRPSIHQRYFSGRISRAVDSDSLVLIQVGLPSISASNLEPETSSNINLGLVAFPLKGNKKLSITLDIYQVNINNRVTLSNLYGFSDDLSPESLKQFFTDLNIPLRGQIFLNDLNTQTRGIDLALNYHYRSFSLRTTYNWTQTKVRETKVPDFLMVADASITNSLLFGREQIGYLERGQPHSKWILFAQYKFKKVDIGLTNTRFGEIAYRHPDGESLDEVFAAKWITDLRLTYIIKPKKRGLSWLISIGANNLLNVFPDQQTQPRNISEGRFVYNQRISQFGVRGRFVYGKVSLKL